ncbi:unnamed protein product [Medioppia subpectinata]|uniref:Uncharacterized protein n=1 Tax=Medioppia subpectinata TaxID=1979941 RepID=A0A7R9KY34_9ACAR|nr:unnamed protein product [Medioppia subpectinata]CAG2111991.1 unnamed protein product [Medioppia subpectinata]
MYAESPVICEENPIDYGEQANTDAIKLRVYTLVEPIGQILDAAEKRYKKQGLTVPIELYHELKEFVLRTIPWLFDTFKAVANETDRERVTAQFLGEVHGFNYMSKRLDKIRLGNQDTLNITGTSENLLGRLKTMVGFMVTTLDDEIAHASHPVWTEFHIKIKEFVNTVMPKLYMAIDKLPYEELKQKNLKILIADLSHAAIPPL